MPFNRRRVGSSCRIFCRLGASGAAPSADSAWRSELVQEPGGAHRGGADGGDAGLEHPVGGDDHDGVVGTVGLTHDLVVSAPFRMGGAEVAVAAARYAPLRGALED